MSTLDRTELNTRKPYTAPHLEIYGNLQQMTQTVGASGAIDNTNPNHQTVLTAL